jgi:hypothetical protein
MDARTFLNVFPRKCNAFDGDESLCRIRRQFFYQQTIVVSLASACFRVQRAPTKKENTPDTRLP